jgi:Protein of unknown function (DUF1501)
MNAYSSSVSRRSFLGAAAVGAGAVAADMTTLDVLSNPLLANELKRGEKRVILLWLAGGASQLETFDPKPGRPTGGPYRAIPTAEPGIHVSELMPKIAERIKHTAIIRSLDTKIADHGQASRLMHIGRRDEPSLRYPDLGAMLARELGQADSRVPDYVNFYTATEGRGSGVSQSGFLGARYNAMFLTEQNTPQNLHKLDEINDLDHQERADLRNLLTAWFARGRESAPLASHNEAYARVRGLMASERLFDISSETPQVREKYGPTLFGEQALIARRLIEAGVPFVKVSRAWWDSHGQNFETHLELVTELDHVMSALVDDLKARGLLDHTLIVTLSEFGRTPVINASLGRDHFASAWSVSLTGCGIRGGTVYGASDEDGQTVKDGKVGASEVFATIFQALGLDHQKQYQVGSRPVPLTDMGTKPIKEVLA